MVKWPDTIERFTYFWVKKPSINYLEEEEKSK